MNDTQISTKTEVLLHEDFDYIYTGKNEAGNVVVGFFVEEMEDESRVRYLQTIANKEQLYGYFSGKTSLYDFLLLAKQVDEHIKSYSGRTVFSVIPVEKHNLKENFESWKKVFFRQLRPSFFDEIAETLPEYTLQQYFAPTDKFTDYSYTTDAPAMVA